MTDKNSSALFTGDWHLSPHSLHIVDKVVDHILDVCSTYHIKHVFNLGDMKSAYSPIDGRVINAGVKACTRFKKAGIEFYICLGNHDRYNLFSSVHSWLPVLRKA